MKSIIATFLSIIMLFALTACGSGETPSNIQSELSPEMPDTSSLPEEQSERSDISQNEVLPERSDIAQSNNVRVRLTFEGGEAIILLENNATARDFASALPLTQTFEDFNNIEKICRLPEDVILSETPSGVDPIVADVTLYVPWNTLVFYYDDYGFNSDLIPIGHVESGMDLLAGMGDEFTVIMELVDEISANAISSDQSEHAETTDITLTVGSTIITATLDNSETSQEFLATLPQSITMNRYADREYYGRIAAISENGESVPDFENGDVTYYPAGPSFAVFFDGEDRSDLAGLIRMGKITSDLSDLNSLGESVEMLIEIDSAK